MNYRPTAKDRDAALEAMTDSQLRHAIRGLVPVAEDTAELFPEHAAHAEAQADQFRAELRRRGASEQGPEESCSSATRRAISRRDTPPTEEIHSDTAWSLAALECRPLVVGGQLRTDREVAERGFRMAVGIIIAVLIAILWFALNGAAS
jgi:hypothetical protein